MAGRIVVGIDGSDESRAALGWAGEEARLRKATLVALHAWVFVPPPPVAEPGMIPVPSIDFAGELEAEQSAAQALLDDAVASVESEDVEIEKRLVEAPAGEALVEAAADAELVVVGTHGHSALAAALLGSVSHHVVKHALCPVVIVRSHNGD